MKNWLITNNRELKQKSRKFNLHIDGKSHKLSNIKVIIEGYVIPRDKALIEFDFRDIESSISNLFEKYGKDFIKYIKGNFTILICEKNEFHIFSDHFAIKKFFIWQKNDEFIISNNLKLIAEKISLKPSKVNMALYALTYHFTAGRTLFENVSHNVPAQVISFKNNSLNFSNYWNPDELLTLSKKDISIKNISEALGKAVDTELEFSGTGRISLSLTGGADTRNLLATFLKREIKPHLYTYGNPQSADCVKAATIAKGLGLDHSIHDIKLEEETFEKYAREIIKLSGGLASIHRAHRLIAVELENEFADIMFLGTLGGEFVKGVSEDNYIVPPIVYDNWDRDKLTEEKIGTYLKSKDIKEAPQEELISLLNNEPYLKGEKILRKFNSLSYITAHLHDAQDINLYYSVMKEVYTPFLDIDYLELLFSSPFTFNKKEIIKNKYLRRIENPVYCSNFINETYKPLLKFKYSGEHKGSEVLLNKYFAAIMKFIRQKTMPSYPPNFPLGSWMENFVTKNLSLCLDYPILKETFDLEKMIKDFKNEEHLPKESYYLKYTNPIMMKFIIDEFCEGDE